MNDKMEMTLERKLNRVENVSLIERDGSYNFMVIGVGKKSMDVWKNILIAGNEPYHRDIAPFSIPDGLDLWRCGGGQILLSSTEINAYGGSGEFGIADQRVVIKLLTGYAGKTGRRIKVAMGGHYFGVGYDSSRTI